MSGATALGRALVAYPCGPVEDAFRFATAGLALEREAIGNVFASDDATEGIVALGGRWTPAFQGR